jgi:RimJ/RimL family protein N-acetyltransferase
MNIRRMVPTDAPDYRALMLEAYELHPLSFTTTAEERASEPLSWWEARLQDIPDAPTLMLGAFHERRLAGVVGLSIESRRRTSHKATLFGMYVAAPFRRGGIAASLCSALMQIARSRPGLRIVRTTVTQGNRPAEDLFRGLGFVPYGVEPFAVRVDDHYVSKVHLWCDLADPSEHRQVPEASAAIARSGY